jgi:hypothetical protein
MASWCFSPVRRQRTLPDSSDGRRPPNETARLRRRLLRSCARAANSSRRLSTPKPLRLSSRLALSARAAHDDRTAARVEANIGACHFALHQYRAALASFLNARRFLESLGDLSNVAVADANIASLYYQMGDCGSGIRWLDAAISVCQVADRRLHLAEMLIQRGVMRAAKRPDAGGEGSFREGIEAAAAAGDWKLYATGCNNLGDAYTSCIATMLPPNRRCSRPTGFANSATFRWTVPTARWDACGWRKAIWLRRRCCSIARSHWRPCPRHHSHLADLLRSRPGPPGGRTFARGVGRSRQRASPGQGLSLVGACRRIGSTRRGKPAR